MITKFKTVLLSVVIVVVCFNLASAQETHNEDQNLIYQKFAFYDYRGSHAIEFAAGSAFVDGDYPSAKYEVYFRAGYKHYLTRYLNLNISFNSYQIAIKNFYDKRFMSYDLNAEFLFSPSTRFTPFIYIGGGYNASNDFDITASKVQAGMGLEVIVTNHLGLRLFGEYNYMFTDESNGLIDGEADGTLIRMGFGVHIYFGGQKKKEAFRRKMKTVINSNLIIPYN